jgi:hypothetical protein
VVALVVTLVVVVVSREFSFPQGGEEFVVSQERKQGGEERKGKKKLEWLQNSQMRCARPGVRRLSREASGWTSEVIPVAPELGLPPRNLGVFLPVTG